MHNKKCAIVAVIGAPNAGKSTLVNAIVGEKVSIVSHKIQTTRRKIRGIIEIENTQLIFVDTPGFCKPRSPLEKVIASNFKTSYKGCDIILLIIDATSKNNALSLGLLERLKDEAIVSVVINKVDIAKKENILNIASQVSTYDFVKNVFMISALKNDGIEDMKRFIVAKAPENLWLFDSNRITDLPLNIRLAEITREKLFYHLEKELPYSVYVETENFHETEKKAEIHQSIVVMKPSQKGIVLGRFGNMIRIIKYEAIKDMQSGPKKEYICKMPELLSSVGILFAIGTIAFAAYANCTKNNRIAVFCFVIACMLLCSFICYLNNVIIPVIIAIMSIFLP